MICTLARPSRMCPPPCSCRTHARLQVHIAAGVGMSTPGDELRAAGFLLGLQPFTDEQLLEAALAQHALLQQRARPVAGVGATPAKKGKQKGSA